MLTWQGIAVPRGNLFADLVEEIFGGLPLVGQGRADEGLWLCKLEQFCAKLLAGSGEASPMIWRLTALPEGEAAALHQVADAIWEFWQAAGWPLFRPDPALSSSRALRTTSARASAESSSADKGAQGRRGKSPLRLTRGSCAGGAAPESKSAAGVLGVGILCGVLVGSSRGTRHELRRSCGGGKSGGMRSLRGPCAQPA